MLSVQIGDLETAEAVSDVGSESNPPSINTRESTGDSIVLVAEKVNTEHHAVVSASLDRLRDMRTDALTRPEDLLSNPSEAMSEGLSDGHMSIQDVTSPQDGQTSDQEDWLVVNMETKETKSGETNNEVKIRKQSSQELWSGLRDKIKSKNFAALAADKDAEAQDSQSKVHDWDDSFCETMNDSMKTDTSSTVNTYQTAASGSSNTETVMVEEAKPKAGGELFHAHELN